MDEMLVNLVLQRRCMLGLYDRVNIELKWNACVAKFVNALLRLSSRQTDFVNAFTERADVGDDVDSAFLGLLRNCKRTLICFLNFLSEGLNFFFESCFFLAVGLGKSCFSLGQRSALDLCLILGFADQPLALLLRL